MGGGKGKRKSSSPIKRGALDRKSADKTRLRELKAKERTRGGGSPQKKNPAGVEKEGGSKSKERLPLLII